MPKKPELSRANDALDRFTKALKSIFSIPRKDAEGIRARNVARSVPDTATVSPPRDEEPD